MLKTTSLAIAFYIASQAILLTWLSIKHSDSSFVMLVVVNSIPALITYLMVRANKDSDIRVAAVFAAVLYVSAVCYFTYKLFLPRAETMIAIVFFYLLGPWTILFAGFCFIAKIVRRAVAFPNAR